MPTTLEKPISTSADDIPQALKDFVHENIQLMDEKQLRAWKRESEKIMRQAKRQVTVASVATAARAATLRVVRIVVGGTRRAKSGVR